MAIVQSYKTHPQYSHTATIVQTQLWHTYMSYKIHLQLVQSYGYSTVIQLNFNEVTHIVQVQNGIQLCHYLLRGKLTAVSSAMHYRNPEDEPGDGNRRSNNDQ